MLTPVEKLLFLLVVVLSIGAAYVGFRDVYRIVQRGEGQLAFSIRGFLSAIGSRIKYFFSFKWLNASEKSESKKEAQVENEYVGNVFMRAIHALVVYITQYTTLKTRRLTSLFHYGIVLGFTFFFLVNAIDTFIGLIDGFEESLKELSGFGLVLFDLYRLFADVLSIAVLVGMVYFILRRLVLPNKKDLTFHDNVLLHPKVKNGAMLRDSMIVGIFILLHVGARFMGESIAIAMEGHADLFQPFASVVAGLMAGSDINSLMFYRHVMWWLALGGIFLFLPYFPYTKHFHLMMTPVNFLTRPERTSLGELEPIDFEDESREQFGAHFLEDLSKTQIVDAFSCIMCNRCQDVCPAYVTGKELSPSALEINKRYFIKENMSDLANGAQSTWPLMGNVISESAVWACTSCAACIEVCPVGNEPMFDILDIRRDAVLTQGEFPAELQDAFNGMERQGNPWNLSGSRVAWTEGLDVPTVDENPDFDVLYWTGCAVSYDANAQHTARSFIQIMQAANVNFAILGEAESCTGDVARRAGNEYLYFEMASANVETLNSVNPKRIVATCPHCLHNIGKEYHQFGGEYEVIHHTELITELINAGKLPETADPSRLSNVTFHDPCYLGRHNDIIDAPRDALTLTGSNLIEMPRHGKNSFCCGAGGAQFWKEEEEGDAKVNIVRYEEAKSTGAEVMAVGCPFCMTMFADASKEVEGGPIVKDVADIIAESLTKAVGD